MNRTTAYRLTITETAEMLGFDYPQHFTRTFKRYFGISPSEYQKKPVI